MVVASIVANFLALVVPELSEGTEPQQGKRNGLALPDLFPESNCGMVAVAPMVALAVVAP